MSKTIYCAFDDCDLADLAMGSLQRAGFAIQSIETIGNVHEDDSYHPEPATPDLAILPGLDGNVLLPGIFSSQDPTNAAGPAGSPSATIKIVCDDRACQPIVSKLVNFGAHRVKYY